MKKLLIFLVLVGLACVAGAYWINHAHNQGPGADGFTLAPVEYGTLTETVSATGVLQPHEIIPVGSMVSGQVVEIYPAAKVGNAVEEGTPLLKLDDKQAQITLKRAQTAVELARKNVALAEAQRTAAQEKVNQLRKIEDVSFQKELIQAQYQLDAANAAVGVAQVKVKEAQDAVEAAEYGLELTTVRVRGGIDGPAGQSSAKQRYWIIKREVYPGQMIAPPVSAKLFLLASDLNRMEVHAQVSENDIGKVQPGQAASFTVYAYAEDEARFPGRVASIGLTETDIHGARFYDTVIDAANRRDPRTNEWMLRPGMTASVDIILRKHQDVWKMPTAALSFQLDEQYQTEEARNKLATFPQQHRHPDEWKPVWVLGEHDKPWPVFVKIGGRNAAGESGIGDGQYNEVLAWDPEIASKLNPKDHRTYPKVITAAPPVAKRGLFDRPNIKVF